MAQLARRTSTTVKVGNVRVGSSAPVVVQSMTNTDTADVQSTIQQVAALAKRLKGDEGSRLKGMTYRREPYGVREVGVRGNARDDRHPRCEVRILRHDER